MADKSTSQDSYMKPGAGFGSAERAAYKANKLAGSRGGEWFGQDVQAVSFGLSITQH